LSEEEFDSFKPQLSPAIFAEPDFDYDVTLSFAGEDREYVEQVASSLYALGIRVFCDRYEEADLWGKDLFTHLDDVYKNKAKFCIVFISKDYASKLWTNHKRKSAQARAFKERSDYILPVKFDDTEIEGILETTGYIDANAKKPADLALLMAQKTGMDTDLIGALEYLRDWLPNYEINLDGTSITFICETEDHSRAFPTRLIVEMYKEDMLDSMFLIPAIVPW
jgi:hypothetical protein